MGFYKNREAFIETFAATHYQVKHAVEDGDEYPRRSFFRINGEEELSAAAMSWIQFPAVVITSLGGSNVSRQGSIRQLHTTELVFLQKLERHDDEPTKALAISEAYDTTYEVMQDFIQYMLNDAEGNCFSGVKEENFRWDQHGPVGDELYGWRLTFTDETRPAAYNPAHFLD